MLRLGTSAATDGTLSWVPREEHRRLPLNSYLLRSGANALVVDTAPAIAHPALADQIADLAAGRHLHVVVTRNDPEAMGGVGHLVPRHRVRTFFYYGGGSILEWVWDARDGPGARGDLFDAVPVASPPVIKLDGLGPIFVMRPPLAVLNTVWLFHEASGILFTSDAFGYLRSSDAGSNPVVDDVADIDADRARAFVAARFDWVNRINNTRLVDELRELLDPLDIGALAPSHGVVVVGREAVRRYLDVVMTALAPADAEQ